MPLIGKLLVNFDSSICVVVGKMNPRLLKSNIFIVFVYSSDMFALSELFVPSRNPSLLI